MERSVFFSIAAKRRRCGAAHGSISVNSNQNDSRVHGDPRHNMMTARRVVDTAVFGKRHQTIQFADILLCIFLYA
jgi:hypothetical protein